MQATASSINWYLQWISFGETSQVKVTKREDRMLHSKRKVRASSISVRLSLQFPIDTRLASPLSRPRDSVIPSASALITCEAIDESSRYFLRTPRNSTVTHLNDVSPSSSTQKSHRANYRGYWGATHIQCEAALIVFSVIKIYSKYVTLVTAIFTRRK